jgi:enamine deaminase RidA (YjgF/YER057c/UK114 family)
MMTYKTIIWDDISANIQLSCFEPKNGAAEYHAVIRLFDNRQNSGQQIEAIETAISRLALSQTINHATLVFKRYFVSDATNIKKLLQQHETENVAVSIVQQPPLNGAKIGAWLYFVENCSCQKQEDGCVIMQRTDYKHLYHLQLNKPLKNETQETEYIFQTLVHSLSHFGCTLKENCIRTWIFVQGVDIHYANMVNCRKTYLENEGLTPQTHFIASTGIEGRYFEPNVLVLMDAYSIKGIENKQIKYLNALSYLNPTYEYGVTFERGTSVDYGDRRHIFISGTASINHKGQILHSSDVIKQAKRTIKNIKALLADASSTLNDIAQMIVYLRDIGDYKLVSDFLETQLPNIPTIIVLAPVCRPGWLIEIECIAIKEHINSDFPCF